MTLKFLNDMSFYDSRRRQMRFVGHDGSQVVSFRIDLDAFFEADLNDKVRETEYLSAFYHRLDAIHDAARILYGNGRRSVYVLSSEDLG